MNLIQAYRTPENITIKEYDSTLLSSAAMASLSPTTVNVQFLVFFYYKT